MIDSRSITPSAIPMPMPALAPDERPEDDGIDVADGSGDDDVVDEAASAVAELVPVGVRFDVVGRTLFEDAVMQLVNVRGRNVEMLNTCRACRRWRLNG